MPHLPHTVLVLLLFCVSCLATLPQLTVSRGKITTSNHTPFIPRGANYIRLNASQGGASPTDPTHPVYHSTFSPRLFNATQAQARLAQLHAQGYNIVRVFVDHGDPTRHDSVVLGNYLSPRYMDNVATFVRLASRFHMYTIPTLELFPSYVPRYNCNASVLDQQLFPYPNAALFVAGCVRAKRQYGIDFLFELKQRLGSLSSIGMVLIENELSVSVGAAPFLATPAGSVRPANNQTYDLSNSSQRLGLVEDSGRFWSTSVRTGLRSIDPNVLVGVGMFTFAAVSALVVQGGSTFATLGSSTDQTPKEICFRTWYSSMFVSFFQVGRTFATSQQFPPCNTTTEDCRVPPRPSSLQHAVDVLDVHVYQSPSWAGLSLDLDSSDWKSVSGSSTPIVMGEFGAFRAQPTVFATPVAAAVAMVKQQVSVLCVAVDA